MRHIMDFLDSCIICFKNSTENNDLCENCLKIDLELDITPIENFRK